MIGTSNLDCWEMIGNLWTKLSVVDNEIGIKELDMVGIVDIIGGDGGCGGIGGVDMVDGVGTVNLQSEYC